MEAVTSTIDVVGDEPGIELTPRNVIHWAGCQTAITKLVILPSRIWNVASAEVNASEFGETADSKKVHFDNHVLHTC